MCQLQCKKDSFCATTRINSTVNHLVKMFWQILHMSLFYKLSHCTMWVKVKIILIELVLINLPTASRQRIKHDNYKVLDDATTWYCYIYLNRHDLTWKQLWIMGQIHKRHTSVHLNKPVTDWRDWCWDYSLFLTLKKNFICFVFSKQQQDASVGFDRVTLLFALEKGVL